METINVRHAFAAVVLDYRGHPFVFEIYHSSGALTYFEVGPGAGASEEGAGAGGGGVREEGVGGERRRAGGGGERRRGGGGGGGVREEGVGGERRRGGGWGDRRSGGGGRRTGGDGQYRRARAEPFSRGSDAVRGKAKRCMRRSKPHPEPRPKPRPKTPKPCPNLRPDPANPALNPLVTQCESEESLLLWVRAVNWVAAATSQPPLSAAVSNSTTFLPPIAPSGVTQLSRVRR